MKLLSIFARFGIMGAMVIALAYKMNESMTVTEWWEDALLVGAFLSAISFEFIGYLNGHSMEGYWRIGDYVKAGTSAVLLIVYSIVAIVILWDNESLRLLPVVAAIVYFSAPLVEGLEVMAVEQEKKSAKDSAFERQEQIKESQHRRDMEARQLEIDAQNALQIQLAHEQAEAEVRVAAEKARASIANAEARKAKARAEVEQNQFALSQHEPALEQFECEDCKRPFGTVQALNAHGRFCPERVSQNGKSVV